MTFYSLNLPMQLQQEAERYAASQGISLEQFIIWAVAEKVGILNQFVDDPAFPEIIYRRGASGQMMPVLRGTGLRVQTLVIAAQKWGLSTQEIAAEYDLNVAQVDEALAFYSANSQEIEGAIAAEQALELIANV